MTTGGCSAPPMTDPPTNPVIDVYGYSPYNLRQQEDTMPRAATRTKAPEKHPRSERLEARISKAQKELFVRAAELQGRSLTDFLLASVLEAALATVRSHEALRLSDRDRQVFVSALLASPAPAKTLAQAAKRYRERTGL